MYENNDVIQYLCKDFKIDGYNSYEYIDNKCDDILHFLDSVLKIESCKNINSISSFDENIIRMGVSENLDTIIKTFDDNTYAYNEIKNKLNDLIKTNGNNNNETDYIKIHETEKSGISLQITKTRAKVLKKIIKDIIDDEKRNNFLIVENPPIKIDLRDIKFISASTNADEIEITCLSKISKDLLYAKDKMNSLISETYLLILDRMEKGFFKS